MGSITFSSSFVQNGVRITTESITVRILAGEKGNPGSVRIDGYFVDPVGKTDLTDWEVNDKFWGWVDNTRYVAGIVVDLPFDVDDNSKVKLVIDSSI